MTDQTQMTLETAQEYLKQESYAIENGIFPKSYLPTGIYAVAHGFLEGHAAGVEREAELLKERDELLKKNKTIRKDKFETVEKMTADINKLLRKMKAYENAYYDR